MSKYKNLETYIEECLTDPDRKLAKLTLFYETATGGTKEILTQIIEGKTWDAKTLYRVFSGRAETHVQDRQGNHTFTLDAYFDAKNSAEASHTFIVIDGEIKNGGSARNVTEHPNQTGIIAQFMRHLETKDALMVGLVQGIVKQWSGERNELLEQARRDRNEMNDATAIVRELTMAASDREHEQRMKELQYLRTTQERDMMMKAAPALINTITGKEVIPAEVSDSMLIDTIGEAVTNDQIELLVKMGVIKQEVAGILIARFAQTREKKAKEIELLKKIPAGETSNVINLLSPKKKTSGGNDNEGGAAPLPA